MRYRNGLGTYWMHCSDRIPLDKRAAEGRQDHEGHRRSKGQPGPDGEPNKAYFYISLVGEGDGATPKSFKFDPGNVLNAKGKMVADSDVSDFADSECGPIAGDLSYRTEAPVKASPVDKLFQATFKFKMGDGGWIRRFHLLRAVV